MSSGFAAKVHKRLPEGTVKVRYEAQFYRLKPRKKVAYSANIELHIGLRYLIWSRYARCFYERVVDDNTLPENISYYTKPGILFLWPTEENRQEIKEDVAKHKTSYWQMIEKRQLEVDHERHLLYANKGDAYLTKNKQFRQKRYGE